MLSCCKEQVVIQQHDEASPVRLFMEQYFEAWGGGVPERVLSYFSEDVVIKLRGQAVALVGKDMVEKQWIVPTLKSYPKNRHCIKDFVEAGEQVTIEWLFTAVHARSGKQINLAGRSVYIVSGGLIRQGDIYFEKPQAERGGVEDPTALPRAS
jgi:hypothetical protein